MKKHFIVQLSFLSFIGIFSSFSFARAADSVPSEYTRIQWVGEPGITSYMRAPEYAGYIDYLTVIDLTKNQIKLMSTSTPRVYEGPAVEPFQGETAKNWLFNRSIAESLKKGNPEARFIWNAPFFNVDMRTTVLSLGIKSIDAQGEYISTGGRPTPDMAEARRMLIIDNKTGKAKIADFDAEVFVNEGDQAVEGFHPLGSPSNRSVQAARVYLGVRSDGNELIVYCSNSASKEEASHALTNAGVPEEQQIQVDGGGSATCGYNLPGQYFVEPGRALPHLMGAFPMRGKGTTTIQNMNVRSGPGTSYSVVRKLPLGTSVTLYEEKNGWGRISSNEWISMQYVKKVKTLPYTAKTTLSELNVRSGAGTNFAVSRKVPMGTSIKVLEEKNGWARISETEWVMMKYIQ